MIRLDRSARVDHDRANAQRNLGKAEFPHGD
jgi:hypothetical protein